jgi:hypothetical protein
MPKSRAVASYETARRWTVVEARAALSALEQSGLSVSVFAARAGLDMQRLYAWRRRLDRDVPAARPAFIEVTPSTAAPLEIVHRSGHVGIRCTTPVSRSRADGRMIVA